MRATLLLSVSLTLLLIAPASPAQYSTGGNPAPDSDIWWIHRNSDDSHYWMSTVKNEAKHNDPDPGYNVLGLAVSHDALGVGCDPVVGLCFGPLSAEWNVPLEPVLTTTVDLVPEEPILFDIYTTTILSLPGAGTVTNPAPGVIVGITAELTNNGEVVATGSVSGPTPIEDWTNFPISVVPTSATLSPGEVNLKVVIDAVGGGILLGASDETGWTAIDLPLPESVPPEETGEDQETPMESAIVVEEESFRDEEVRLSFSTEGEPVTATMAYNWTSALQSALIGYSASVENGTVSFLLEDATGTLLESTVEADFNASESFGAAEPGNWTLTVELSDFQGAFEMTVGSFQEDPASPDQDTSTDEDAQEDDLGADSADNGNEDSDTGPAESEDEGSKGLPGFGVSALAAVLALAAFASRRRP